MNYLLGTDIGTSGTKTILMDTEGKLVAQDLQEYDVLTPAPLWAEQWPDVWYEATKDSIRNTVAKAKEAGLVMTGAGATFPYGKDPHDSNIRIAPSYPTPEELSVATDIFVLSVKLISIDKLLGNL